MTPSPPPADRYHGLVLVGFMGAGKTSVGAAVADGLGWRFVDVDAAVEVRAGTTVAEIFETRGEAAFRELEAAAARDALGLRDVVVATGGGWPAAAPGRLEALPDWTLSVWLRVSPGTAVRRARSDGVRRPLLEVDDPVAAATALLGERRSAYTGARLHLDTEGATTTDLARTIVRIVRGVETLPAAPR